jgi:hypothetical protein
VRRLWAALRVPATLVWMNIHPVESSLTLMKTAIAVTVMVTALGISLICTHCRKLRTTDGESLRPRCHFRRRCWLRVVLGACWLR